MTFDLNDKERRKLKRWYSTKHKKCRNGWKFIITPTGIGDAITAVCVDCYHCCCNMRDPLELTDYGTW